jgi:hypothetical protein
VPRLLPFASLMVVTACFDQHPPPDHRTPEAAARTFVEAGRRADLPAVRAALVAAEHDEPCCDYRDLGDYRLEPLADGSDRRATVVLRAGSMQSTLVCLREHGEWKVSVRESLRSLQKQPTARQDAAPR